MGMVLAAGLLLGMFRSGAAGDGRCAEPQGFAPKLVVNEGGLVRLRCGHATAMEVIEAVGQQTRRPLGLVLGRDETRLTREQRSYDLRGVSAETALLEALNGTGYTLRDEDGVLVMRAGDRGERTAQILGHRFAIFPGLAPRPMFQLGQQLTMWVWAELEPGCGLAGGGLSATNELGVQLRTLQGRTAEEIANAIVTLGPHGMWVLRTAERVPQGCNDPRSVFTTESYQHASNAPVVQSGGDDGIF